MPVRVSPRSVVWRASKNSNNINITTFYVLKHDLLLCSFNNVRLAWACLLWCNLWMTGRGEADVTLSNLLLPVQQLLDLCHKSSNSITTDKDKLADWTSWKVGHLSMYVQQSISLVGLWLACQFLPELGAARFCTEYLPNEKRNINRSTFSSCFGHVTSQNCYVLDMSQVSTVFLLTCHQSVPSCYWHVIISHRLM